MSTCFLPLAADLRSGDEVLALGSHRCSTTRVVASVQALGEGRLRVSLHGAAPVEVSALDDVDLRPPF